MRLRRLLAAGVPLCVVALTVLSSCSTTAAISDVYMALDGDGNRRRTEFTTDTREIHCIAEGAFGRKDVTVEGYVRQVAAYDQGKDDFVLVDTYFAYAEFAPEPTPGVPAKLDIALNPVNDKGETDDAAPFVAGSYVCEIYLEGEKVRSVEFNIRFSECPVILIVPGSPCFGFYRPNEKCPRFGAKSSEDRVNCTCTPAGAWNCPE